MTETTPARPPMGRLDAIDVGARKLTIQTEFFPRPLWRIETKVYLAGALKKVFTDEVSPVDEPELQQRLDRFHQEKMQQIVDGLRSKQS